MKHINFKIFLFLVCSIGIKNNHDHFFYSIFHMPIEQTKKNVVVCVYVLHVHMSLHASQLNLVRNLFSLCFNFDARRRVRIKKILYKFRNVFFLTCTKHWKRSSRVRNCLIHIKLLLMNTIFRMVREIFSDSSSKNTPTLSRKRQKHPERWKKMF